MKLTNLKLRFLFYLLANGVRLTVSLVLCLHYLQKTDQDPGRSRGYCYNGMKFVSHGQDKSILFSPLGLGVVIGEFGNGAVAESHLDMVQVTKLEWHGPRSHTTVYKAHAKDIVSWRCLGQKRRWWGSVGSGGGRQI